MKFYAGEAQEGKGGDLGTAIWHIHLGGGSEAWPHIPGQDGVPVPASKLFPAGLPLALCASLSSYDRFQLPQRLCRAAQDYPVGLNPSHSSL